MRQRRTSGLLLVALVAASAACFKDDGPPTGADDATASATTTATSLAPTTTGTTSAPTTDDSSPFETSSSTEGGSATTTGMTDTGTSGTDATTELATSESIAECGNGILEGLEECDLGPANADNGLCTTSCITAFCGDGLLQPVLGEECDQGPFNQEGGACLFTCKKATCGDGYVFLGVEECDHGEDNQAGVYGGCTPMTCTLGPHCGDDELQKPFEECDHGDKNGTEGDACGTSCKLDGNVVFVTSETYTGLIGGISGADYQCNKVAMEGGLPNAGAFKAWISDGVKSPSGWVDPPPGPFLLLDGTPIAESWADLLDGELMAPIYIQEDGALIGNYKFAWTGTSAEGLPLLAQHCEIWTNDKKGVFGAWGDLASKMGGWTNKISGECQTKARLICIEQ